MSKFTNDHKKYGFIVLLMGLGLHIIGRIAFDTQESLYEMYVVPAMGIGFMLCGLIILFGLAGRIRK